MATSPISWAGPAAPIRGARKIFPPLADILKDHDANKDGKLAVRRGPAALSERISRNPISTMTAFMTSASGTNLSEKRSSVNSVMAVRLGGSGDMTAKNVLWRYYKSLPNATSPVLYRNVLYLVKEGGILTALDAATGTVLKQGRHHGRAGILLLLAGGGRRQNLRRQRKRPRRGNQGRAGLGDPRAERHGRRSVRHSRSGRPALVSTNEKRFVLFWQLIAPTA